MRLAIVSLACLLIALLIGFGQMVSAASPVASRPSRIAAAERATLTPAPPAMLSLVALPGEVAPGGTATVSVAIHRDGMDNAPVVIAVAVDGGQITRLSTLDGPCSTGRCVVVAGGNRPEMVYVAVRVPATCAPDAVQVSLVADDGMQVATVETRIRVARGVPACRVHLPLVE